MRIAIVGSGISGLVCAHLLDPHFDVTLFEADDRLGGHTNTVEARVGDASVPVDTGFIVFNRRTYPRFCRLLERLGVDAQPAPMSFSVSCESTGLEYGGETADGLFAQRRNALRPSFLRMIRDILRFGKEAPALAERLPEGTTLGEFLRRQEYGRLFASHYLVPMGAAIWSASRTGMLDFPLRFFVRFFDNHGMLLPGTRPQWLTIPGGSRTYVGRLASGLRAPPRLRTPVLGVRREGARVELHVRDLAAGRDERLRFDHAILACHSDQALAMLDAPTSAEREVLGALPYAANEAVLHNDRSLMPRARRAWAAWNYHLTRDDPGRATLTYDMTRLQSLPLGEPLCVTLNHTEAIDPRRVLGRWTYHHPQFSLAGVAAQGRRAEISGVDGVSFAGAYWFNGFHEDGVRSAVEACARFGVTL